MTFARRKNERDGELKEPSHTLCFLNKFMSSGEVEEEEQRNPNRGEVCSEEYFQNAPDVILRLMFLSVDGKQL